MYLFRISNGRFLLTYVLAVWLPFAAIAQPSVQLAGGDVGQERRDRLGIKRKKLPEIEPPAPQKPVLPPIEPPPKEDRSLSSTLKVPVRKFDIIGNTIFSDQQLATVTREYENRTITSEELQAVRQKLIRYYIDRGYINSGAVFPDQELEDGVVQVKIIEGQLTDIRLTGNEWLRARYINKRIQRAAGPPLDINKLQERLLLLRQDPLVEQVNAELSPGVKPGESILNVRVKEERLYELGVRYDNHVSPTIGGELLSFWATHHNLTGWGDRLGLIYGVTDGQDDPLDNIAAFYEIPINAYDTRIQLHYDRNDADIVGSQFSRLNITSRTETVGLTLSQPIILTPAEQLTASLTLDKRKSKTTLLGQSFSFADGADNGRSRVTVLRLAFDWLKRSDLQVLAGRSVFNVGIDAFDATINSQGPDGRFFSWLGQFQWARRLKLLDSQVIFRTDLHLANDPLLSLEKFAVGGATTVRGYRQNFLVRDNGWVSSVEFRIPLFRVPFPFLSEQPNGGLVELAPFADFGWSWNSDPPTPDPETISSVGLGLRWSPTRKIHAQLYWGYAFRDVDVDDQNIQDDGVHFLVNTRLF